jgi:sRNA-binding regulator protein Hfq
MASNRQTERRKRAMDKIPQRWGASEALFYAALEGERIEVNLTTGESVKGELVGVDTYAIFVKVEEAYTVLVAKHAIATVGIERPGPFGLGEMENPPHD